MYFNNCDKSQDSRSYKHFVKSYYITYFKETMCKNHFLVELHPVFVIILLFLCVPNWMNNKSY